jgi:tRNA-specific 2-thiouridylase
MEQKKVLVGISGGVDSSVSCALLKDKGYAVSAVFLRFLKGVEKNKKALNDARVICNILDIPLIVIDARTEFEKTVIGYFFDDYAQGKTPNPCVFCNEKMKFKLLFETAKKRGIELMATGHYARIKKSKIGGKMNYRLFPGSDEKKDQAYFLYRLGQEQLSRTIFPLGEYQKVDVRRLAEKFQLPVFDKDDSQDVCFMANGKLEEFLRRKIKLKKGKTVDMDGRVLGEHRGLSLYTIGQRKGIEIGGKGPYFVISKDLEKNTLIVTNDLSHPASTQKKIEVEDVVWVDGVSPKLPLAVFVRTRYHNLLVRAIIKDSKNQRICLLEFAVPQKAVSPGQSVVFYGKNKRILGGGIIK